MQVRSRLASDKLCRARLSKQSDWYFSNKARLLPADRVKTYSGHMVSCERLAGYTGTEWASKKGSVNPRALNNFSMRERRTTVATSSHILFLVL